MTSSSRLILHHSGLAAANDQRDRVDRFGPSNHKGHSTCLRMLLSCAHYVDSHNRTSDAHGYLECSSMFHSSVRRPGIVYGRSSRGLTDSRINVRMLRTCRDTAFAWGMQKTWIVIKRPSCTETT